MTANIEQERQRLAKLYGDMSEGELQKVAGEAAELTDVAHQALAGRGESLDSCEKRRT